AACEPEYQPRIDRAEAELAAVGAPAQGAVAIEQPLELGAGEVGIDQQPRAPANLGLALGERGANRGAASALPYDRAMHRTGAVPFPHHERLALIGDSDRSDAGGPDARGRDRLAAQAHHRAVELFRVVLD